MDYCHMNWRGYGLMADELRRTLEESGFGPRWASDKTPLPVEALAVGRGLSPL